MILARHVQGWLWLSLLVLTPPGQRSYSQQKSQPLPDIVFLLIGQSNMAGRAPLADKDKNPLSRVRLLNDKSQWIPATNPLNRFATDRKQLSMQRIGPGGGFAQHLTRAFPNKQIGLIVNARGGSSIEQWAKGQSLYDNTLKRLTRIKGLKLAAVIWHQGESNRNDRQYPDKLAALIQNLRNDLNSDRLPFIAGQVYGTGLVNDYIRDLPKKVSHTAFASNEGLTVFDKVHFDCKSQQILGARYAEAFLRLRPQRPR